MHDSRVSAKHDCQTIVVERLSDGFMARKAMRIDGEERRICRSNRRLGTGADSGNLDSPTEIDGVPENLEMREILGRQRNISSYGLIRSGDSATSVMNSYRLSVGFRARKRANRGESAADQL